MAVFAGVVVFGYISFERSKANRESLRQLAKSIRQENDQLSGSIKAGNVNQWEAASGRLKDQLGQAGSQMGGLEGAETRALSKFLANLQARLHAYTVAANRLQQAKILSWNLETRAMLDTNRQIVRDFLASNERLGDAEAHDADLLRAEYDTEKVPAHIRDSLVEAYAKRAAALHPLQMEVRLSDRTQGENALAVFDLLEANWGKWTRNATTGRLDFENPTVLDAFNDCVNKIREADAEGRKAEEEMRARAKARR
ncbi:MAG: hypothetical protein P4L99_12445 [Chthoniobacter sp.]|nr:hypothetical protein [Chthoniobacter sp.]